LAPTREQAKIVEALEAMLSDLDAGVAELKAAQRKLVAYRQSVLKAAVEGRLAARDDSPAAGESSLPATGELLLLQILVARRAQWEARQRARFEEQGKPAPKDWRSKYAEPISVRAETLSALPSGWTWSSAEQLCGFITKGTTPPTGQDQGGAMTVPFLRVTNLSQDGSLDLSNQVLVSDAVHRGLLARSIVYPGDVLMNIVGPPLGQVSVVPASFPEWNINQAIAVFRAVDGVLPSWLCLCLLSPVTQRWLRAQAKTTAGQTNLTLEVCRSMPVPLPPTAVQAEMAEAANGVLAEITALETATAQGLRLAAAQRRNLLKAAFSGQLVKQDPADEPASALLARIQAARAAAAQAAQAAKSVPRGSGPKPASPSASPPPRRTRTTAC
jgi:type I restriction enzyme S subunit